MLLDIIAVQYLKYYAVEQIKKIYMHKVDLNIFWHLAQGTRFGGNLGPQFSTHFSMIKTEDMKDYATQCCSNLWKNEKRLFFMNSILVLH